MPALTDHRRSPDQAVVAIPVQNEEQRITDCLLALSAQTHPMPPRVVLLVNNTRDRTIDAVRAVAPSLSYSLHAVEHDFPPALSNAGNARKLAMDHASAMAGEGGPLLCTDADGCVANDWLAANLYHLRHGADAVAGRALIDPVEADQIPARLHEADAREYAYAAVLDEIESLLDPDPADPWPRHTEHSGASICVTQAAFHRAGGIPAMPVGEDRAFFAALRRIDANIRHAPEVCVVVSGRIQGRAAGGMADTIRRRLVSPDRYLDDALEPATNRARRVRLRCRFRQAFRNGEDLGQLASSAGVVVQGMQTIEAQTTFGAAWEAFEARCSELARVRIGVDRLPREMERAQMLRKFVRGDCTRGVGVSPAPALS